MNSNELLLEKAKADWIILLSVYSFFLLLAIWNSFSKGAVIQRFCLQPRRNLRLSRIILHPFVHGNWAHLRSNSIGFFIFGWLTMFPKQEHFWIVTFTIILTEGVVNLADGTKLNGACGEQ